MEMSLTEAEAVAVHTVKYLPVEVDFSSSDVMLVCDAGGSTTDLGLIEIISTDSQAPKLKQISGVSGIGIGSTLIDLAFKQLVQDRLDCYPELELPDDLAERLAKGEQFLKQKHLFGPATGTTTGLNKFMILISHPNKVFMDFIQDWALRMEEWSFPGNTKRIQGALLYIDLHDLGPNFKVSSISRLEG